MEPFFTRVSCQVVSGGLPPRQEDAIGYYESRWDVRTNAFIREHKEKIITALKTYPSKYCYYKDLYIVPQPIIPEFGTDEDKQKVVEQKAEEQHHNTNINMGIVYCPIFQDRNSREIGSQRVVVINVEDNKPQAILAAIRYLARLADQFKDEVTIGSGYLPLRYYDPWQVDLEVECKDLFDTAFDWLDGKNEMYFSQTVLKYDKESRRLWFVDNKGNKDEEFISEYHDLLAQAYYILVWNHPEGIKDSDLYCDKDDLEKLEKVKAIREEFTSYYYVISQYRDSDERAFSYAQKQVNSFCNKECKETRSTARSRIKSAFRDHETNRVNKDFAKKVAEYYSFNAKEGKIKVINRSTTIILPDSLMSDRLKKYNAEQAAKEDNADSQS